jgi:hypothetical protein
LSEQHILKTIASGTIFGGLVDCYVLSDKTRVISMRGAVRALTRDAGNTEKSGGHETGNLRQYLRRLPSKYGHLAAGTSRCFALPSRGGESFPTFACKVVGKLYKIILPAEVYAEMRNRNGSGEDRKGKLHQFFQAALWRFVHNDIPFVAYMARVSRTRREFWNHMHARYGGQSFQMGLGLDEGDE